MSHLFQELVSQAAPPPFLKTHITIHYAAYISEEGAQEIMAEGRALLKGTWTAYFAQASGHLDVVGGDMLVLCRALWRAVHAREQMPPWHVSYGVSAALERGYEPL